MAPAIFVPLLILGILTINVAIWIPIVMVRQKNNAARIAAIEAEVAAAVATGERVLCPPVVARVRRGHVTTSCAVALTNERVIMMSRARSDVSLTKVRGVRDAAVFNSNVRAGFRWVILALDGSEMAIALRQGEHAFWMAAVKGALPSPEPGGLPS